MSSYLGLNMNPAPRAGKGGGAFGAVPGELGLPPSIYQEVQSMFPGLDKLTSGAGDVIKSQLAGQLSPETMRTMQDYAAARGVSMGQPNSAMSNMIGMNILGTSAEQLQQQGQGNYMNFLTGLGSTQLDPNLVSNTAQWNATMAAAPNPEDTYNKQKQDYQSAMNDQFWNSVFFSKMTGGGGGGGYGGTGGGLQMSPLSSATWDSNNASETSTMGTGNPSYGKLLTGGDPSTWLANEGNPSGLVTSADMVGAGTSNP